MRVLTATLLTLVLGMGGNARAWDLVMPDTLNAGGGPVTLAALSTEPVPAGAAPMVVVPGGRPGTTVTVSRQGLLRKLVEAGLADRVRMRGASRTTVVFGGGSLDQEELKDAVRRSVQPLVPGARPGAPASWISIGLPELDTAVEGEWEIVTEPGASLVPGRNLVPCRLVNGSHADRFTAAVFLHAYGEVATTRMALGKDSILDPGQFDWRWVDLDAVGPGAVVGRETLAGRSLTRSLASGVQLRESDIVETPVIRAGDPVDLTLNRGPLAVTVLATARQAGCLGQTIPVRNEVSGRLVNARVTGPGLVEWRR